MLVVESVFGEHGNLNVIMQIKVRRFVVYASLDSKHSCSVFSIATNRIKFMCPDSA